MKDDQGIPDSVWACTEPESTRYAIGAVKVVPRESGAWLAATDERLMVVRSTLARMPGAVVMRDGGKCELPYPRLEEVLADNLELPVSLAIHIDCRLLAKAQAALLEWNEGVLVVFGGPTDPIRIVGDRGIGLVMPMESAGIDTPETWSKTAREFIRDCGEKMVVAEMIS